MSSRWPGRDGAGARPYPWIAPSILASDLARLAEEVKRAEAAGADILHLDVMDGHFVPNLTFGMPVVQAIRPLTALPLDVHLMIERPSRLVERFAAAGADSVTLHVEAEPDDEAIALALGRIRALGVRAGLSLRPATSLDRVQPFLPLVDLLLVMSVDPGFGGQPFLPASIERLQRVRAWRKEGGLEFQIEVDGGIDRATTPAAVGAGAEILVAGTALYGPGDMAARVAGLRAAAR